MSRWLALWTAIAALCAGIPASGGTLEISVLSADGELVVTETYLGVVPQGAPWKAPVFETIAAAGDERGIIAVPLPAGEVRVVCSALEHGIRYLESVQVPATGVVQQACTLPPLSRKRGRAVARASGEVVTAARVGPLMLFQSGDFPQRLSALGERHLRANYVTSSDAAGWFELRGMTDLETPVWIEAEGFAPALIQSVRFDGAATEELKVPLDSGGSLEVYLSAVQAAHHGRFKLFLQPLGAVPALAPAGVPLPSGVLARWVQGDLERWPSLPAGRYRVLLKGMATGAHGALPQELAEVELQPGNVVRVAADLSRWASLPVRGPAVAFLLRGLSIEQIAKLAVLRFEAGNAVRVEPGMEQRGKELFLEIPAGCQAGMSYLFQVEGLVGAAGGADLEECIRGRPIDVAMVPSARITGTLVYPPRVAGSMGASVYVESCETVPPPAARRFPLHIAEDRRFQGEVPAGCVHLTIEAAGFAPITLPRQQLAQQSNAQDLGQLLLKEGAAALVQVRHADGASAAEVEVALFLEAEWYPAAEATFTGIEYRSPFMARTGENGWVRLAGLPRGRFYLRAVPPAGKEVPSFLGPFELEAGKELLLPDLYLPESASLEVALDAGSLPEPEGYSLYLVGILDPGCGRLRREGFRRSLRWTQPVQVDGLVPGEWHLAVFAQGPPGTFLEVAQAEVSLPSGGFEQVALEATGGFFQGHVVHGSEPVRARLEFLPRFATQLTRIPEAYANTEGRFVVGLPQPGPYLPRVWLQGMSYPRLLSEVRFDDPELSVELRVPSGSIAGTVVDETGQPVAAAIVGAKLGEQGQDADAVSGPDGSFRIAGLMAGQWSVLAASDERSPRRSSWRSVELGEDQDVTGITLVLGSGGVVSGQLLVEGRRPLAAAAFVGRLQVESTGPQPQPAIYPISTDHDGRFEVQLQPGAVDSGNLEVRAPGFPVTALRVPVAENLTLSVPQAGGQLVLHPGQEGWQGVPRGLLISEGGGWLQLESVLAAPPFPGSQNALIAHLAPGVWQLQPVTASGEREMSQLVVFELEPGNTVELTWPAAP